MPDTINFSEAIELTAESPRAVLLGNGFSIAQAGGNFDYANLLEYSGLEPGSPIRNVFRELNTIDFEEVMHALEQTSIIETAYDEEDRSVLFQNDANHLREALIHAVKEVHPAIQFDVPDEQHQACAAFLKQFANVFTLNYDLLLYWVILNAEERLHSDGFGLGDQVGGFRTFQEDAYCSTYYLHGALHLFLNRQLETQKRIVTTATIIDDIAASIRHRQQLPLYVAEGSSIQKKSKIYSIPYLRHCYEELTSLSGSLFVFGHSVADNDEHIYDAIFESKIEKFVFCVHRPEDGWDGIRESLARYAERRDDIEFLYVDASSANVWGEPDD
ncbi:DUF4917 family protein [Thalassospira sp.]|uniref:DUF4917 family protein n=1 Tax=Thalassospira sp. TaxID=1912094 RepID=UPI0032EB219B